MQNLSANTFYYILGAISTGGLLVWKVVSFFTGMAAKIDLMLTNHLPHIDQRLTRIEENIFETRSHQASQRGRNRKDR